jgi:hypothetical protein
VRPPEWQNPRPEGTYDVVAISVRLSEVDRAVLDDETEDSSGCITSVDGCLAARSSRRMPAR